MRFRAFGVFLVSTMALAGAAIQERLIPPVPGAVALALQTGDRKSMNSAPRGDTRHSQRPHEAPEGPWPQFQADPQRTGQSRAKAAAGRERWVLRDISFQGITASPVIGPDHTVYIGTDNGQLFAVNGTTGAVRWVFRRPNGVFHASAVVSRRQVFAAHDDVLYALDAKTGRENWNFKVHSYINGEPVFSPDGTLYLGDHTNHFYALDAATGRARWEWDAPDRNFSDSTPAMGPDGTVYVGSSVPKLYALNGATGALKWTANTDGDVYTVAVDRQNRVLVGCDHGMVHCLDGATGDERWHLQLGVEVLAHLAIGPGGVVYLGADGKLYALESSTGKQKWVVNIADPVGSAVAIAADGLLYVGGADGYFYALDSRTGATEWRFRADTVIISSPAIDGDGAVYFASMKSLYAVE